MPPRVSGAFQTATRSEIPDSMSYSYLEKAQQSEGKYPAAIKSYQEFMNFVPASRLAKDGIRGCELALKWKQNPTRYVIKNAKLFNSRRADFSPMFHADDEDILYFTSSTEKALGAKKSEITGTKQIDIFFANNNERGEWQRPAPVAGELNT